MIYASKLMMQQQKPIMATYVEDGLIKKVEDGTFGSAIEIPNIKDGTKGFTFCGTIPYLLNKTVVSVVPSTLDIFIYSNNKITWRNMRTNVGVIPSANRPIVEDNGIQPYIAVTLYYPTKSSQEVSFDFEGVTINTSTVSVVSATDATVKVGTGSEIIDLGLVYDRVLTPEELTQNYKAFLAKHR